MPESIRYEFGGVTFRLFPSRRIAIGVANQLTRVFHAQFNALPLKGTGGFLVSSVPIQEVHDAAGQLPQLAMNLVKNKGSYFELSQVQPT